MAAAANKGLDGPGLERQAPRLLWARPRLAACSAARRAHRYDCLETILGNYLEGRSSGSGHPTKLAVVQYVSVQSGAQGSGFKITDLGADPLVL